MTRIAAVGDLHGHLPKEIPECDLLLIAGDICPTTNHSPMWQKSWLDVKFRPWLECANQRAAGGVVGVAGNHDWVFYDREQPHGLPWTYLEDSSVIRCGLKIHGSPWQPPFCDWAFNLPESELERKWELIPNDTDILLLHGPPYGYGDLAPRHPADGGPTHEHTGSKSLEGRIEGLRKLHNLDLVIFGHIHEGFGMYPMGDPTRAYNVSYVNAQYEPSNGVTMIDL